MKLVALFLMLCLAGGAFSQSDALFNMMLMRNFLRPSQGMMDPTLAQNTNALATGTATDGQAQTGPQVPGGSMQVPLTGRPNMMRRILLPTMMGYDFGDPMMMYFMFM